MKAKLVIKIEKIYFVIKNTLEAIGASFLRIFLLEPEILKVNEWFQVKVPTAVVYVSDKYAHNFPPPGTQYQYRQAYAHICPKRILLTDNDE